MRITKLFPGRAFLGAPSLWPGCRGRPSLGWGRSKLPTVAEGSIRRRVARGDDEAPADLRRDRPFLLLGPRANASSVLCGSGERYRIERFGDWGIASDASAGRAEGVIRALGTAVALVRAALSRGLGCTEGSIDRHLWVHSFRSVGVSRDRICRAHSSMSD